jgi:hypothetical protein
MAEKEPTEWHDHPEGEKLSLMMWTLQRLPLLSWMMVGDR